MEPNTASLKKQGTHQDFEKINLPPTPFRYTKPLNVHTEKILHKLCQIHICFYFCIE